MMKERKKEGKDVRLGFRLFQKIYFLGKTLHRANIKFY